MNPSDNSQQNFGNQFTPQVSGQVPPTSGQDQPAFDTFPLQNPPVTSVNPQVPPVVPVAPEVVQDAPEVAQDAPGGVPVDEISWHAPEVAQDAPEVAQDAPEVAQDAPEVAQEIALDESRSINMDQYLTGSAQQVSQPEPFFQQPAEQEVSVRPEPPKIVESRTSAVTTSEALNPRLATSQNQNPRPRNRRRNNRNRNNNQQSGNNQQNNSKDEVIAEIEELERKVNETKMPDELRERAVRSIERLRRMARRGSYTGEFETVEKYIYWITSIPWGTYSDDNLDVANAKRIMDQSHYGMNTVKNLVLDYLAVMQLQIQRGKAEAANNAAADMAVLRGSSANAPVMIFVGLQGVGKTSIAKSIANAMGREFARVAVGAVGSVQALRGQSKAFLDAEPGGIIKALVRTKSMNPVILLDEIDKASGNSGLLNDIMAALLEILDPEQNSTFIDHYLDYPVDLSKVFFICTANNLGSLSAALLDRMEVIRFTSYSDDEKIVIAKNYSMPKVIKNSGLGADQLVIEDSVWPILVRPVGFDAGLRQLERNLATMVRAAARRIVEGTQSPIVITPENVREFVLPDQGPLS